MSGMDNLVPVRSEDEAREKGSKGGRKSGESRRAKRDARETAKLFLNMSAEGQLRDNLSKLKVKTKDCTNLMGIIARLVLLSQSGNIHAARLVMELSGDLQNRTTDNNLNVNIGKDDDSLKVVLYVPEMESEENG